MSDDECKFTRPYPYVIDNRKHPLCHHYLGEGSSLVVAVDGCSLECTFCHDIVVKVEPLAMIMCGDDVDWIE